ncbi:putative oxidoreductase [Colletotrichum tanaceti]|uniref:Putative oxidoreductase n=1 Tax=Colletotrichum tanaceti TaxID=1306861 RepID=A0A4U6WYK2_9PEZI|nr:putative oxidoreductase [Colletotrichum tanaceti]
MPTLFVYEKDLVDPTPRIPSLEGKVIFVTGGPMFFHIVTLPTQVPSTNYASSQPRERDWLTTHKGTAGLGKSTILALLAHNPSHIYFSGRSLPSAEALIASVASSSSSSSSSGTTTTTTTTTATTPPPLTFVQMDLASLASVKAAVAATFAHDRLDILVNNAGITAGPAGLSADGYEVQFATNHLGHAMLLRALLPVLQRTAALPGSDVRVVTLTSLGYQGHPADGISFSTLRTKQVGLPFIGQWVRYGYVVRTPLPSLPFPFLPEFHFLSLPINGAGVGDDHRE